MRLPVGRRRAAPLRGAGLLNPGRPLPPLPQRLVVFEELGELLAAGAGRGTSPPRNRCRPDEGRDDTLRRRIQRRILAPEIALPQENIEPRADDDCCANKRGWR